MRKGDSPRRKATPVHLIIQQLLFRNEVMFPCLQPHRSPGILLTGIPHQPDPCWLPLPLVPRCCWARPSHSAQQGWARADGQERHSHNGKTECGEGRVLEKPRKHPAGDSGAIFTPQAPTWRALINESKRSLPGLRQCFLVLRCNFLFFHLCPLVDTTEKSLVPSLLHPLFPKLWTPWLQTLPQAEQCQLSQAFSVCSSLAPVSGLEDALRRSHGPPSCCTRKVSRPGPSSSTLLPSSFGQDLALSGQPFPGSTALPHQAAYSCPTPQYAQVQLPHSSGPLSLQNAQFLQQGQAAFIPQATNNANDLPEHHGTILVGLSALPSSCDVSQDQNLGTPFQRADKP